jgi:hypothetical protein
MADHEKQASMLEMGLGKELAIDTAQSSHTLAEVPTLIGSGDRCASTISQVTKYSGWRRAARALLLWRKSNRDSVTADTSHADPVFDGNKTAATSVQDSEWIVRSCKAIITLRKIES